MKEQHRLLDQGATDAERALLHSASADGPPDGVVERMMTALDGLTAGSGDLGSQGSGNGLGDPSPGAPMAAHSLNLGPLAKVGLAALVGAGVLGSGVLLHRLVRHRSVHVETSAVSAPAMKAEPALGSTERPGAAVEPSPAATPATSAPSEMGTAPRHRQANPSDESLSAELRILDLARSAVDARNSAAAQRALDSYAQRFPQGHLRLEATVLRLAVLVHQGDRAAAKSLAAQLLASESHKTYEPRIRSLLREIGE
jgi:hypothetical protein